MAEQIITPSVFGDGSYANKAVTFGHESRQFESPGRPLTLPDSILPIQQLHSRNVTFVQKMARIKRLVLSLHHTQTWLTLY